MPVPQSNFLWLQRPEFVKLSFPFGMEKAICHAYEVELSITEQIYQNKLFQFEK